MKNLLVRAASGVIYVGVIILTIFYGGDYGFPALCCLMAAVASTEFFRMTDAGGGMDTTMFYDIMAVLALTLLPLINNLMGVNALIAAVIALFTLRLVMQLYKHDHSPAQRVALSLMSYAYIGITLGTATILYLLYGPALVFTMFAMIWLNDTGAFLVGSAIGRHKLFKRISPNKSWEGFFGGLAFAVATGAVISLYVPFLETGLSLTGMCLLGLTVCIAGTWGDLFESLLKRAAHVKDSGHIMPGHGGILDRIDSLLFVAPATWLFMLVCSYF